MLAVIFEVEPAEGKKDTYLEIAAELRPMLEEIEGFISIERFESLVTPGKILSLSFWRDDADIEQWRNMSMHRDAQAVGRGGVFKDYRLRVAEVLRDYGMRAREEAPEDSREVHD